MEASGISMDTIKCVSDIGHVSITCIKDFLATSMQKAGATGNLQFARYVSRRGHSAKEGIK
jgi:hypothetical protein